MAGNKKPKKKYNPDKPGPEFARVPTDRAKKSGMSDEHKARLHHPIDVAIHKLVAGKASVVDLHNILYRAYIGRDMSKKFLIPEDQKFFAEVAELCLKIKRRNESTLSDPREHVWSCNAKEHALLCQMHALVIDMHDEIHRKHFVGTYKSVNTETIQMLKDFDKKFPVKKKEPQDDALRRLQQEALEPA